MSESISLTYIQLKHDELPVQKIFRIDGKNYIFNFDYNAVGDFYTFTILDDDENPIYASKLTYLRNSIQEVVTGLTFKKKIVPLNLSDVMKNIPTVDRISKTNFDNMRVCII
ncbi:MAG: hypothetical protein FWH53_00855 [Leptospirales bacterium]|nr:hypothetical protein [Leptospirales bacterium]